MQQSTDIGILSEVFRSFQGEGEYVGHMHVFIRLAGCIFECPYCDTDFEARPEFKIEKKIYPNHVSPEDFVNIIIDTYGTNLHAYSFTGGEPLIQSKFIYACAERLRARTNAMLLLETSGMYRIDVHKIDGVFDVLSVDIKTYSKEALGYMPETLLSLRRLQKSDWYLKLLVDKHVTDSVLDIVISNMKQFMMDSIILQPVNNKINQKRAIEIYDKFFNAGITIRLIPQTHKMLKFR